MAEVKPPLVKGKAGKGLAKKVGPFSAWVWIVIIAGGAAAYWFLIRGRSGGGDATYGGPEVVSGGSSASPQDMAGAGAPSQNGAPSDQLSPDVLSQLQSQIGDLGGHVTQLEDAAASGGWTRNDDKTWSVPGGSGDGGDSTAPAGPAGPAGARGKPGKPGKPGKKVVIVKHVGGKKPSKGGGKTKATHPHPAAAAHPAAKAGAHRATHPAPVHKAPPKPAKKPVKPRHR